MIILRLFNVAGYIKGFNFKLKNNQNLRIFPIVALSLKNKKTSAEGVIAPGILTLLSAILCYGLSDKIYI